MVDLPGGLVRRVARNNSRELIFLRLILLNAVFDKTDDQRQASAGGEPGEGLQNDIIGGVDLIQAAAGGDHGDGKLLQESAAQRAADRTDEGVT